LYVSYLSSRRIRGAGWVNGADNCTVAYRGIVSNPDGRLNSIGFRLARSSGN
jgi:formylglycine-generating enzyme required for sulfatase activity